MKSGTFLNMGALRRRSFRELTIVLLVSGMFVQSIQSAAPGWWLERGLQATSKLPDDFAALNQGQLKNFARAAIEELHFRNPNGAGPALNSILAAWRQNKNFADDYAVVTIGQLKAVAKPIYEAMRANGQNLPLPWTEMVTDDDNHAVANLGQAKRVFSFSVQTASLYSVFDKNGDGFWDLLQSTGGSTLPGIPSGNQSSTPSVPGTVDDYPDPYPGDYPDFNSEEEDSDEDGVSDAKDAVPYDPAISHERTGMPHYMVVDLGLANFGFVAMSHKGTLLWRPGVDLATNQATEGQVIDPEQAKQIANTYSIWKPGEDTIELQWDEDDPGMEDATFGTLLPSISDDGRLVGMGMKEPEGEPSARLFFTYDPFNPDITARAVWLPDIREAEFGRRGIYWGEVNLGYGSGDQLQTALYYVEPTGSATAPNDPNTGTPNTGTPNNGTQSGAAGGNQMSASSGGGSGGGRNTAAPPSKEHPATRARKEKEARDREREKEKEQQKKKDKDPPPNNPPNNPVPPEEEEPQPQPPGAPDDLPPPQEEEDPFDPDDTYDPRHPLYNSHTGLELLEHSMSEYTPTYEDMMNSPLTSDEERMQLLMGTHPNQPADSPPPVEWEGPTPLDNASLFQRDSLFMSGQTRTWFEQPVGMRYVMQPVVFRSRAAVSARGVHQRRMTRSSRCVATSQQPPSPAPTQVQKFAYVTLTADGWVFDNATETPIIAPLPAELPEFDAELGESIELGESEWTYFDANCGGWKTGVDSFHRKRHSNDRGIELGEGHVGQQGCPTLWTANSRF